MSVVIRMKQMGRKHRAYFRICAADSRSPRDGKVIEEIGSYDPKIPHVDARCLLDNERVAYWLGVGAKPSEKVGALIKKYGPKGTHLAEQTSAREKLSLPKIVPPAGEAVYVYTPKVEQPAEQPAAASGEAPAEGSTEAAVAATGEAAAE